MALRITCPWMHAEIKLDVGLLNKGKFVAWCRGGFRFEKVSPKVDVGGGGIAGGGKEATGRGIWRAGTAVSFPDVAFVLPVGLKVSTECSGNIPYKILHEIQQMVWNI